MVGAYWQSPLRLPLSSVASGRWESATGCVPLLKRFFFSRRRGHTRCLSDWSSDVCSSDLALEALDGLPLREEGVDPHAVAPPDALHHVVGLLRQPTGVERHDADVRTDAGHEVDDHDVDRKSVV